MTDIKKVEDRNALIEKLSNCIKSHNLDLTVDTSRETVCALAASTVEDKFEVKVEKKFGPDMKEKVDAFKKDADAIVEGIEGASVKVSVEMKAGCMYDTIKNVKKIEGGEPVNLEHKKGEVWLIDFWATWCPPCQAPMAHNEEMLKKRGAEWGDKVKIVCISIDQTAEAVVKHVDAKDWKRPIHYHRDKSDCSEQYGVRGVPNVMLIDTEGKIVFKGHPASRPDLEKDFDTLLKGEKITGAGTEDESKGGEEAGEDAAAAGKERDSVKDLEFIDECAKTTFPGL